MKMAAIRGAITIDLNTEDAIKNGTVELMNTLIEQNDLNLDEVVYINFACTKDITKAYPAKFVRNELGITHIPMMCGQEMDVEGTLGMCIRVLIVLNTINEDFSAKHFYLKGAKILRPDIKN